MKDKMASNDEPKNIEQSIQHFFDEYDDIRTDHTSMTNNITRMTSRLRTLEENILKTDEAIEDINKYSFQYNVKILGVPKHSPKETAKETVDICLKLFRKIGAEVSSFDIDIAHRVSPRDPKRTPPIICKFTRRITKEAVMSRKRELRNIDLDEMGLQPNGKISIYDHLTPKAQMLFQKAKEFQRENGFKFCWTGKNSTILLRESDISDIIRVTNQDVLLNLKSSESSPMFGAASGRGRYTRSSYRQDFNQ